MLWSPNLCLEHPIVKQNWPYLFKESIRWYPDQYWTEIIAYIISLNLGVDVPKAIPAVRQDPQGRTFGSLIEWFYDIQTERFSHGGNYFKRLIPDFNEKTGAEHNIRDLAVIARVFTIRSNLTPRFDYWLADVALFDALIGNTDRHQENWGIIFYEDNSKARFSPLFDNGTSLGHERFLDKISQWDSNHLEKYIEKGRHHFRENRWNTESRIQHFELIEKCSQRKEIKLHMTERIKSFNLEKAFSEISELTKVNCDIPLTQERVDWIKRVLSYRFNRICKILNHEN